MAYPRLYVKKTSKGRGLFAGRNYQRGSFIAFYTGKWGKKSSKFTNEFSVGTNDLSLTPRVANPKRHLAAMANEPSENERSNATLLECYFSKDKKQFIALALFAVSNISKDSEIMWYYGDDYPRQYNVNSEIMSIPDSCEDFKKFLTRQTSKMHIQKKIQKKKADEKKVI